MAKEGYWDDQFNQALPVFLANWYASTFIDSIEQSCEKEGVGSLLSFTNGYYKADLVGQWISRHTGAVKKVMALLASNDPIHRAIHSRLAFVGILKRGNAIAGMDFDHYPEQFVKAMDHALGKRIQKTKWWKDNSREIKRGSRQLLAVKKLMEC